MSDVIYLCRKHEGIQVMTGPSGGCECVVCRINRMIFEHRKQCRILGDVLEAKIDEAFAEAGIKRRNKK